MNQESVGKFMAALRKEKKLTQKQFAEILGVNDRSVSRWENGYCMPDLSLLQIISEELGVSISELLNGRHIDGESRNELSDAIDMIIELSNKEKDQKAKKVNHYFITGMFCFVIAVFHGQFDILSYIFSASTGDFMAAALVGFGIVSDLFGFYYNLHIKTFTKKELELLLKSERRIRMKTAREMLQFAGKNHEINKKQYKLAFEEIENNLMEGENVIFSATGTVYTRNELPVMWHVALAVTKDKIIIAGERMKGMIMTSYESESFPVRDITSIETASSVISPALVIRTLRDELKIEEEDSKTVLTVLKELQSWYLKNNHRGYRNL